MDQQRNGSGWHDLCIKKLTATNTIQSCKNTSWTWQSRDGRARTRVDYILIPTKGLAKITENTGTVMWTKTNSTRLCNWPPAGRTSFQSNTVLRNLHKSKPHYTKRATDRSKYGENTWEAWDISRRQQMMKQTTPVDKIHIDRATVFQQRVQQALEAEQITTHTILDKQFS